MKTNDIEDCVMSEWPGELRDAVEAKIKAFWETNSEHFDYVDRRRICRLDNQSEIAVFQSVEEEGCCGCYRAEWMINGVRILYGFNYGH
jgi:hypothetical protein